MKCQEKAKNSSGDLRMRVNNVDNLTTILKYHAINECFLM